MAPSTTTTSGKADAAALLGALSETRERTLALVAPLSDDDLERVHDPIMSPLIWDLGHIAAYEDLWLVHRFGGEELLRPDLAALYDAFETPRAVRGDIPFLRRAECLEYMAAVRERALAALVSRKGSDPLVDSVVHEMVLQHEQQHTETMLQTLGLAGLLPTAPEWQAPAAGALGGGLDLVAIPAGEFEMGAPPDRFSYDNERPRHAVHVPAFRIGRTAVTNATWLSFTEGGGYVRREWWSDEGWAWKEDYDITHPASPVEGGHPDKPVVHVSWFEADAFARSHGVRLPTEAEWEKAATWDQMGTVRPFPWGDSPVTAEHANVDQRAFGTAPVGSHPAGAAACGALGMIGDTWEWTSTVFDGYPGFAAHPYPEYSQVFFGERYRVLRGGSWATRARVATPTFRNWDLPQRRQIFAGVRLAKDSED